MILYMLGINILTVHDFIFLYIHSSQLYIIYFYFVMFLLFYCKALLSVIIYERSAILNLV